MLRRAILLSIFILSAFVLRAQKDSVASASRNIQVGLLDQARIAIDAASDHPESKEDSYTWYLKGAIYKEIYKKQEKDNRLSPSRIIAVESFRTSMSLDKKNENINENKSNLKYLASTFYNDAAETLNDKTYQTAITNFNNFKKTKQIEDAQYDIKTREIEFKLALATIYERIYYSNRQENESFFDKQEKLYAEIIELDSNNISANYNFGLLYYNKAVNIINELDYDIPFEELMKMQDGFVTIFKQSLPYVEKAHRLTLQGNKVRLLETVKALMGIYFSLNELEKYNDMKKLHDELEKK